jgi:hypothetical protein
VTDANSSQQGWINYLEVVRWGAGALATPDAVADDLFDINGFSGCSVADENFASFGRNQG